MAVKQFPADYADITALATKILAAKADGTLGFVLLSALAKVKFPVEFSDYVKITAEGGQQRLLMGNQNSSGANTPSIIEAANGRIYFGTGNTWAGNGGDVTYKATILENGNFGLGTTEPDQKLHVIGNILSSGSITPGSDKRLKKDIKDVPSSMASILALRPVSYTLKEDGAEALGFIADEVREIFPELVLEGKDDEKMLAMNYMGLTAPIVKAIQEMSSMITELKERVAVLEAK